MRSPTRSRLAVVLAGMLAALASLSAAGGGSAARAAPAKGTASATVWLCRPGQAADPCTSDLTTTLVARNGSETVEHAFPARNPAVDCFYVYPTISGETTINADRAIDLRLEEVAIAQASRFSQVCRVYAPVYRQVTLYALEHPALITRADALIAYDDVLAAFRDYLAHDNHGRGVIVIGHSQGASMLIGLLRRQVDADPAQRRLLVSAMLFGGNVTVPVGRTVGGTFQNIPACMSDAQVGCVLAYSSFDQMPPADSLFGRPGQGVSLLAGATATTGLQVLCTNPADLAGTAAVPLSPYFPTRKVVANLGGLGGQAAPVLPTPWVTQPGLYTGQCLSEGGATWLQVTAPTTPGDTRQVVGQTVGPTWGLHLVDVNIALGDLVDVARAEAAGYAHHG